MDEAEIDRSLEIGEKALGLSKFNGNLASPENYKLWYTFASGLDRALVEDVKQALQKKKRLDQDDIENLYKTHFSQDEIEDKIEQIGSDVSLQLDHILQKITKSADDTKQYGNDLGSFKSQLDTITDQDQLKQLIGALASRTVEMSEQSKQLSENLEQSQNQIHSLKNQISEIRVEAMTDGLTNLANRKKFDIEINRQIEVAVQNHSPLCLAMIDIDHFKAFNDTHGHQTGDQVIRLVGQILKENTKGQDLPARYGGEEFAIILPNTKIDNSLHLLTQISHSIRTKKLVKKNSKESLGAITVSIGISQWNNSDVVASFIERADKALYFAKESGRDCVKTEDDLQKLAS